MKLARRHDDPFNRHLATVLNRTVVQLRSAGEAPSSLLAGLYSPGEETGGLDRAAAFDLTCYLPGDILTKVDRASMAHGLEVRAPFLDGELVDFVLSMPTALRFDRQSSKSLLAAAVGDLWPRQ